ncbi:MAG: thiamine biosynthesis protein ThiF [Blastocatellia bacterium]
MFSERYSRQILFPAIGLAGQEKLAAGSILVLGCGALGASHCEMLARAGVGHLRIVDRDFVEYSNLQRQTLFKESDAEYRLPKAVAAAARIAEINSTIAVELIVADANSSNIEDFTAGCDLILDGTDNFEIRYLINDLAVKNSIPWIYGAAVASYGATMTIIPTETPCLRCIFPEIPEAGSAPTCDTAGVIMPIISSVSAIQVSEAIKYLSGNLADLHRSLLQIDVWSTQFKKIALRGPDTKCPACNERRFEFLDAERRDFTAVLCGRNAVQISPANAGRLDLDGLADKIKFLTWTEQNDFLLRFEIDNFEITVFRDSRAIVRGTEDVDLARRLYAKYIGN